MSDIDQRIEECGSSKDHMVAEIRRTSADEKTIPGIITQQVMHVQ
jgi:hypothetical protein